MGYFTEREDSSVVKLVNELYAQNPDTVDEVTRTLDALENTLSKVDGELTKAILANEDVMRKVWNGTPVDEWEMDEVIVLVAAHEKNVGLLNEGMEILDSISDDCGLRRGRWGQIRRAYENMIDALTRTISDLRSARALDAGT